MHCRGVYRVGAVACAFCGIRLGQICNGDFPKGSGLLVVEVCKDIAAGNNVLHIGRIVRGRSCGDQDDRGNAMIPPQPAPIWIYAKSFILHH